MLGRKAAFDRVWQALTKKSPANLMVVGSRYMGKTVFLNHIAACVREGGTSFRYVVHWHMGRDCPKTNDELVTRLCRELLAGLEGDKAAHDTYSEFLRPGSFDALRDVLDDMASNGVFVLMLWDMLDSPLSQPGIGADLWGQVRGLFYGKPHRVIVSSRDLPSNLVRDTETEESPFWNIFDQNAVRLAPFDDEERASILQGMVAHQFTKGATTELQNWTGGIPVLFLGMLNQIVENVPAGEVTERHVNDAAPGTDSAVGQQRKDLWRRCSETEKQLYHDLWATPKGLPLAETPAEERSALLQSGFASKAGDRLQGACRLQWERVKDGDGDRVALKRLFKEQGDYDANVRGLLELRLALVPDSMDGVKKFIRRGIGDLPESPDVSLSSVRGIVDAALDKIFAVELGAPPMIPPSWFVDWKNADEKGAEQYWNGQFPRARRGHQIRLLQLMTGTQNSTAKSTKVTKTTCVLLESAHGFGDFGQHVDGGKVTVGVAATAMMTCIELALSLAEDLK